jgi:hypothetical protein
MGDSLNWNRFWVQFESEIDKTSKPAVTKFAYTFESYWVNDQKLKY